MPKFRLREDWNTGPQFLTHYGPSGWGNSADPNYARIFRTREAAQKIADKVNPPVPYTYRENHFYVEEVPEQNQDA